MKFYPSIVFAGMVLFSACSTKELSKEEATAQIRQQFKYPKAFEYELNLVDPLAARKVAESNLDESGFVIVKQSWSPAEAAEPKITFTDKSKSFLLGVPADRKEGRAALVKLADVDIAEVNDIRKTDNNHAVVAYTTVFKNVTPFSVLVDRSYSEAEQNEATFTLIDGKWQLDALK